jgi:hypothetical protein
MNEGVRERAYRIWENEGRPHGRDLDHWLQAEREVAGATESGADARSPRGQRGTPPKKRSASRSRALAQAADN